MVILYLNGSLSVCHNRFYINSLRHWISRRRLAGQFCVWNKYCLKTYMSTGLWSSADPRLLNLISETCPVCSPLWWNERGTPTCHSAGRTHPQTLWWSSSVSSSPLWSSTAVPGARACGRQGVFNWWFGDMDLGGTQYSTLDFDLVVFQLDPARDFQPLTPADLQVSAKLY